MTTNAKRLQGKTAVITGGSTGIGFATAEVFLAHGAIVIITGQNPERLNSAVEKLKAKFKDGEIHGVKADVQSIEQLTALADATKKHFNGRLDILFVNSGVLGAFAPFEDITEEVFDYTLRVNFKGAFFTVQKLAPLLGEGSSVIFDLSTIQGKPMPFAPVYAASKAAGRSLVRSLAVHFAPKGIRVNSISPGPVPTDALAPEKINVDEAVIKGFLETAIAALPLKRPGRPEEIANATLFLASDDSSYVTGADLLADGGMSA